MAVSYYAKCCGCGWDKSGRVLPRPAAGDWRDAIPLKPVALARRDEVTRAVTLIMDAHVAEAAVHAITADAMEREAQEMTIYNHHRVADRYIFRKD